MMLLKPDDFREAATAELERAVAAAPERLSDRQQAVVVRVRERLGDKLFQRLGWQPRCKPSFGEEWLRGNGN